MGYSVVVEPGLNNIMLSNGYLAQGGDSFDLSPEHFFAIKEGVRDTIFNTVTEFQLPA